ncbi:MAG: hypothetical protein JST80_11800 [Bdellovibrionales bacterium]|nr:hypothetical protein [Bdellovibrionales bacterium]
MKLQALFLTLLAIASSAHALDRFVVISDSHGVGQFGMSLVQWLSDRDDTAYEFYASGGTAPVNWLNGGWKSDRVWMASSVTPPNGPQHCTATVGPSFAALWNKQGPRADDERRISLIVQGTNLHYVNAQQYKRAEISQMKKLIQVAYAQSELCYWIGPPEMKKKNYTGPAEALWVKMIRTAISEAAAESARAPCEFFDSRPPNSHFPAISSTHQDQVHYHWMGSIRDDAGIKAAGDWAFMVTSWLESKIPLR